MTETVRTSNRIGALQIGIILLALATAIIHIALAIPENLLMFYLNGLGYIVLTAALFLPQLSRYRNIIRWLLIAFTLVTILAWAAIGMRTPIGYIDKLIEVALVVLLFIDGRQSA